MVDWQKVLNPAIEQLKQALAVVKTNEPINRKRGEKAQADLERENGKSYRAAIEYLKERK